MDTTLRNHTPSLVYRNLQRDLVPAIITGQVAGLIMAVVMMAVFALLLGTTPWYPVQVIGSLVFGDAALVGFHLPAFLVGLVLHQAGPSLFWSVVFGLSVARLDRRGIRPLVLGLGIGVTSQVVDVVLILPVVMQALHGHDLWAEHVPRFWSWAAHLVFGLSFALFPAIRARLPAW